MPILTLMTSYISYLTTLVDMDSHGCRMITLKCCQAGFRVSRNTAGDILRIVDPAGVELRRRRRLDLIRCRYYGNGQTRTGTLIATTN